MRLDGQHDDADKMTRTKQMCPELGSREQCIVKLVVQQHSAVTCW